MKQGDKAIIINARNPENTGITVKLDRQIAAGDITPSGGKFTPSVEGASYWCVTPVDGEDLTVMVTKDGKTTPEPTTVKSAVFLESDLELV